MLRYSAATGCRIIAGGIGIQHDNMATVVGNDGITRMSFVAITVSVRRMKRASCVFRPVGSPRPKVPGIRDPGIGPNVFNVRRAHNLVFAGTVIKAAPAPCIIYRTASDIVRLLVFDVGTTANTTGTPAAYSGISGKIKCR